jgi:lambda family phage portal protein
VSERRPTLNSFDRVIEVFSPQAALRRAHARMMLGEVRRLESAQVGRLTAGWATSGTGANTDIAGGFERTRARARDMVQNNEWAASAVRRMTTLLVGSGIQIGFDDKAEHEAFQQWAQSTDPDPAGLLTLDGLIRLAVRSWREGGESLIRRRVRRPEDGLSTPLQLQLLEGDFLDSSRNSNDSAGFTLLGVQHDRIGRRTGYWLHSEHPGETYPLRTQLESFRVPAEDVVHLFDADRIGQVRGVSSLGVALLRLRSTREYEDAVQMRKKVEACFAAFVKTDDPAMSIAGKSLDPNAASSGRRRDKLAPGLISYLKMGEEVQFATPQPSTGEDAFIAHQLRAAAAGSGLSYELLTGDLSKVNFTSHRAGLIELRQHIEELQWMVLAPRVLQVIVKWWREVRDPVAGAVGKKRPRFTMPRKPWVKPTEDVAASKEAERAGYTTKSEILRELGYGGIDEYIEERKAEMEKLKAAGLQTDTDSGAAAPGAPGAPGKPGAGKSKDAAEDDDSDEDAEDEDDDAADPADE